MEVLKVIISFVLRIVVWALFPTFRLKLVLLFVPDVDCAGVFVINAFVLCWLYAPVFGVHVGGIAALSAIAVILPI